MDGLDLLRIQSVWEFDFEADEEVSIFVWRLVEWHTEALDTHNIVRLDYLTCIALYSLLRTVQMTDYHVDTGKSLEQRDFFFYEKIGTLSLERLMLFDFNDSY